MKKMIFFIFLALLTIAVAWYIFTGATMTFEGAKKKFLQEAHDAVVAKSDSDDVAALALKVINMTQGEKGVELWRLKAEWGSMRRNDDIMELEKPIFTYYMAPDNTEIRVTSMKGEIDQSDQKVRFIDSVVAIVNKRVVTGEHAVYFGKSREMVFPQGATITGEGMNGKGDRAVWLLKDKTLEVTGNVDMTFESDQSTLTPKGKSDSTRPPAGSKAAPADAQG